MPLGQRGFYISLAQQQPVQGLVQRVLVHLPGQLQHLP
jgi:hypothetical protein